MEITTNQVNPVSLEGHALTKASSVEGNVVETASVETIVETAVPAESQTEDSTEALKSAVAQINEHMQNVERSLQFTIDDDSGKEVVTVLDKKTEEIIRQFPSEEVLVIARQIAEQKDDVVSLFSSQV